MENGDLKQIGWISEELAVIGKTVKDKDDDHIWKIKTVYNFTREEKEANLRSRDYTKTREASDI